MGHNILLVGPPGAGKSMLAARFPGILPPMTQEEALESAAVQSLSGGFDIARWRQRPYRAPHHTASAVALVGGGCHFQKLGRLNTNKRDWDMLYGIYFHTELHATSRENPRISCRRPLLVC
jgi:magnesium chelatase family protein